MLGQKRSGVGISSEWEYQGEMQGFGCVGVDGSQ